MASCGLPPLGRLLGSAFMQLAFTSGGPPKVFTPRLKLYFVADEGEEQLRITGAGGGEERTTVGRLAKYSGCSSPRPLLIFP